MSNRPAIILITCDEMRLDTLSCYGGTAVKTPYIDSLMEQGTKYENCYTVSPLCHLHDRKMSFCPRAI